MTSTMESSHTGAPSVLRVLTDPVQVVFLPPDYVVLTHLTNIRNFQLENLNILSTFSPSAIKQSTNARDQCLTAFHVGNNVKCRWHDILCIRHKRKSVWIQNSLREVTEESSGCLPDLSAWVPPDPMQLRERRVPLLLGIDEYLTQMLSLTHSRPNTDATNSFIYTKLRGKAASSY